MALTVGVIPIMAQNLKGYVYSIEGKDVKAPMPYANVYIEGTTIGVMTNEDGYFEINDVKQKNVYLKASYTGYASDSILITDPDSSIEFVLTEGIRLAETVVTGRRRGTSMSLLTAQKTELISETGLMKMACCNLSESFENSATITVGFTDAVSGAKQVQLLGLSGIYSQMMDENVPTMRGLASTYGWSYTPGSWLESIQISKGASSVVNGYESITGQINLEHKKPNNTEPLFVNIYVDDAKRVEANVTSGVQVAEKLWMGILAHGSMEQEVHDDNGDTFLDMPKTKLVNVYNRWFYLDAEKGIQSRFGVKFLVEERRGGQDSACHDAEGAKLYETKIMNRNITVYNKTGIAVGDKDGQSLGIITNYTLHDQESVFGLKSFSGVQHSFYANILFNSSFSPSHKYATGVSFMYDHYETDFLDSLMYNKTPLTKFSKSEAVPGAFLEYTYSYNEKLIFILGLRGDYNSKYGWLVTPRANLKYNFSDDIVLRGSAGRGFRSPNIISENIGFLGSSRMIDVSTIDGLGIEDAINYGLNLAVNIPIWNDEKATLSMDYFRTNFRNLSVVDVERDRHCVYYYDNDGSYADAWQVDLSVTPFRGFDVFTAFRYNKSMITYKDNGHTYEMEKPLVSRYRGLVNLSYATKFRKWVFDVTGQINGPSRIPGMNGYNSQKRYSDVFPVFFGQITKNTKWWDVYLGVENLLDYRQKNPIISYTNPFGEEFDSSLIWGPLMGRKFYIGLRLRLF
ncbi:MAG: TonB-dependent receptor [Tannerella sp.]|nr:TonB-dependent receptor [Tannerella sp.]